MNYYVELINNTIEYIEENLGERLALEDISGRFCVSEFHFNRLFKTVVGKTLKQYVLGRKLTRAFERLTVTRDPLIDIAYDFGFEYPEVFSRAFKKQFGVSPNSCRNDMTSLELVERAVVVERDIVNYRGSFALKGNLEYLEELTLEGVYTEVNVNADEFETGLKATGDAFLKDVAKAEWLKQERLYTVVNCHGEDNGEYTVFYGLEGKRINPDTMYGMRVVPGGWYAAFLYKGDMFDIRESFIDDLYRWIMIREIRLNPNGIGMLDIFEQDYASTGKVKIYVPVKHSE